MADAAFKTSSGQKKQKQKKKGGMSPRPTFGTSLSFKFNDETQQKKQVKIGIDLEIMQSIKFIKLDKIEKWASKEREGSGNYRNLSEEHHENIFHIAATMENPAVLHCLIENFNEFEEEEILSFDFDGKKKIDTSALQELLNAKSGRNETPLLIAARLRNFKCVELLLNVSSKRFPNIKDHIHIDVHADSAGKTAFDWALYHGHQKMAKLLLKRGAKVERKHIDLICCQKGYLLVFETIAENPKTKQQLESFQSSSGFSLLDLTLRSGQLAMAGALASLTEIPVSELNVFQAAGKGCLHVLRAWEDRGYWKSEWISPFDMIREGSCTLLHWAVQCKERDVVRFLINKGVNPNIKDDAGLLALDWALMTKQPNLALNLVQYEKRDPISFDTLERGIVENCVAVIKAYLKDHENSADNEEFIDNVIVLACEMKSASILETLIKWEPPEITMASNEDYHINRRNLIFSYGMAELIPDLLFAEGGGFRNNFDLVRSFVDTVSASNKEISLNKVYLLKVKDFLSAQKVMTFVEARQFHIRAKSALIEEKPRILYVSRQWHYDIPSPTADSDPDGIAFKAIKCFLKDLDRIKPVDYIWLEPSCLRLDREAGNKDVLKTNIVTALFFATDFLVLPTLARDEDTKHDWKFTDLLGYSRDCAWQQIEASLATISGTKMFINYEAYNEDKQTFEDVKEVHYGVNMFAETSDELVHDSDRTRQEHFRRIWSKKEDYVEVFEVAQLATKALWFHGEKGLEKAYKMNHSGYDTGSNWWTSLFVSNKDPSHDLYQLLGRTPSHMPPKVEAFNQLMCGYGWILSLFVGGIQEVNLTRSRNTSASVTVREHLKSASRRSSFTEKERRRSLSYSRTSSPLHARTVAEKELFSPRNRLISLSRERSISEGHYALAKPRRCKDIEKTGYFSPTISRWQLSEGLEQVVTKPVLLEQEEDANQLMTEENEVSDNHKAPNNVLVKIFCCGEHQINVSA